MKPKPSEALAMADGQCKRTAEYNTLNTYLLQLDSGQYIFDNLDRVTRSFGQTILPSPNLEHRILDDTAVGINFPTKYRPGIWYVLVTPCFYIQN